MTATVLTSLSNGASILGTRSPAWAGATSAGAMAGTPNDVAAGAQQRFYAALEKASTDSATVSPTGSAAGTPDRNALQSSAAADADQSAQERARRALELESPTPAPQSAETGSVVLDGLAKLRGVFDNREARLSSVMSRTSTNVESFLAVQVEVTNFTLLIDVSSKLTGQSMQALQTLLNGQ